MNLNELIETHKDRRSYADLSRDCGGKPTDKRLQQLATKPMANFPDPPTIRALARGLRVSERAVVLAAAESLGIDTGAAGPRLLELLGSAANDLSEPQAGAIAALVKTFVSADAIATAEVETEGSAEVTRPDLRAVAQDPSGQSAAAAKKADALAKKSRAEQEDAIAEMERKKRDKGEAGK